MSTGRADGGRQSVHDKLGVQWRTGNERPDAGAAAPRTAAHGTQLSTIFTARAANWAANSGNPYTNATPRPQAFDFTGPRRLVRILQPDHVPWHSVITDRNG